MKNKIQLNFWILILVCCNIYNSFGIQDTPPENIVCYTIYTNNYSFVDAQKVNITQEDLRNMGIKENYKTFIIVIDNQSQKTIDTKGYYENKFFDSTDLKEYVDNKYYKIRPEAFDNILGLQWGMEIEDAIQKLKEIRLYSWKQVSPTEIIYANTIAWDGNLFDMVKLTYFISNKQNKYLSQIGFLKICDNAEKAKALRESIAFSLQHKYGEEAIQEEIGDNKFKAYTIMGRSSVVGNYSRINVVINPDKISNECGVVLWYYGIFEAHAKVASDNNQ